MQLSIVLVNYNTAKDTLECLNSLAEANVPKDFSHQIIVVENASTDDSLKILKKSLQKQVKLIVASTNTGFAGGNNLGVKEALKNNPSHILFLNNDTVVPKSFFTDLINSAINDPSVGLVTPKIYFAQGYEFHKDRYEKNELGKVIWSAGGILDINNVLGSNAHVDEVDKGQFKKTTPTDFATGACLLIKKEVVDQIGLFDERYFLYLEDLELSIRAKRKGWQVVFDPTIYLWHKVSQSSGVGSSLNDYFITRNRLLFGFTYASLRTRFALLREAIRFLISGTKAQRTAVIDFFRGRFGKGSWLK